MNGKPWTEAENKILRNEYPNKTSKEVAKILCRSLSSVYGQAGILGLKKSNDYLSSPESGCYLKGVRHNKATEFKKGTPPWNKGMKGLQIGGKETQFKKGTPPWNKGMKGLQIGGKETQFKKGGLPHNTKSDGQIVIREHKGRKYKWTRVSLAKWEMLHIYLWKMANGDIPKGSIIIFKDADTMNCAIDNLEMRTRTEHAEKTRQSDGGIARTISLKKGARGKIDEELYKEIKQRPELIELKRKSLELNREINASRKTK